MSNPILELNQVIEDIKNSVSSDYVKDQSYQEVRKLYENYKTDVEYMGVIHTLVDEYNGGPLQQLEKNVNHKKKEMDIQEYYQKQYQQQIFILKIVIVFAILTMVGCLFFNFGLISIYLLTFYLGFVFSIGFVVVFYYLWDYFLREKTNFDEYNFLTYVPPKIYDKLDKNDKRTKLGDNNILC